MRTARVPDDQVRIVKMLDPIAGYNYGVRGHRRDERRIFRDS